MPNAVPTKEISLRNLIDDVVHGGSCSACGACVVACPYDILQYVDSKPVAWDSRHRTPPGPGLRSASVNPGIDNFCPISEHAGCDMCASVCPKLELDKDEVELTGHGRVATLEERAGVGIVMEMWAARTNDPRVLRRCQDGGLVTTLLMHALEKGIIDGAVVTRTSDKEPCKPVPAVATTMEEILVSAGSWYTYCPNLLALKDAARLNLRRIAMVGTPCQITPIRKWQSHRLLSKDLLIDPSEKNLLHQKNHISDYASRIAFTIGLFCSETFTFDIMKEKIEGELGIPLKDIVKFNIKGKVIVYKKMGQAVEFPLDEAFPYARPECSFCGDFSSEDADISVGGVGTNGWTIVLVRTSKGKELWDALAASGKIMVRSIEEFKKSIKIMYTLARKQRERQERAYRSELGH